ncbi:hypothetical protein CBR_g264 [Chara braunii]|uniref:Uncharacterized protein n=1 Tax=Chara braunii TaxID=69332 RepID=A0A388JM97_CHABU|nr:hypothetical protein CBR_g264 [Chara braunii]|eukprot:GBG58865.1 hypothetical protein CBR_g264 [Chara braunii]
MISQEGLIPSIWLRLDSNLGIATVALLVLGVPFSPTDLIPRSTAHLFSPCFAPGRLGGPQSTCWLCRKLDVWAGFSAGLCRLPVWVGVCAALCRWRVGGHPSSAFHEQRQLSPWPSPSSSTPPPPLLRQVATLVIPDDAEYARSLPRLVKLQTVS